MDRQRDRKEARTGNTGFASGGVTCKIGALCFYSSLILVLLIGLGGNYYAQTVTIGTQVWMTKNLDVVTFRNGDLIPEAKTGEEWAKASENQQPAWCYYDNDPANGAKYGKLYNWHAVSDPRGLAPTGWHVPSDAEWITFIYYLDPNAYGILFDGEERGTNTAGGKMKSSGTQYWISPNQDATNESGFSGLPGGYLNNGAFNYIGIYGGWWSSTEGGADYAYAYQLLYSGGDVSRGGYFKQVGFSVRCLRD
jgi:uncharacterized protein (TIGR02145 family)